MKICGILCFTFEFFVLKTCTYIQHCVRTYLTRDTDRVVLPLIIRRLCSCTVCMLQGSMATHPAGTLGCHTEKSHMMAHQEEECLDILLGHIDHTTLDRKLPSTSRLNHIDLQCMVWNSLLPQWDQYLCM